MGEQKKEEQHLYRRSGIKRHYELSSICGCQGLRLTWNSSTTRKPRQASSIWRVSRSAHELPDCVLYSSTMATRWHILPEMATRFRTNDVFTD